MQEPWKVGVKRGENRLIQSLCGEQLDPTGPLLHLEKRKGLFAKATHQRGSGFTVTSSKRTRK